LKTSAVSSQLGNHWLAEEVIDLGVVHVAVHEGSQLVQGFTAAARVQERALMGDSEVVIGQLGIQTDVIVAPALANFIRVSFAVVVVHFGACIYLHNRLDACGKSGKRVSAPFMKS
jgi:hypothetical protein